MRRILLIAIITGSVAFGIGALVRPHATPAPSSGAPLLVVLHGDRESGEERAQKWREAAERRGWRVLALDCPRDRGCDEQRRWYTWNGDPSWVRQQVLALAERVRIDMSRVFLAGWSGGATYIGKRMPAWASLFAGVVIHGGGVAPAGDACPDRPFPAYFLVGDENPAHRGSVRLREYFERCKLDVKWDLVPGANHPLEDAALTPTKATEILRWLEEHRGRNAEV